MGLNLPYWSFECCTDSGHEWRSWKGGRKNKFTKAHSFYILTFKRVCLGEQEWTLRVRILHHQRWWAFYTVKHNTILTFKTYIFGYLFNLCSGDFLKEEKRTNYTTLITEVMLLDEGSMVLFSWCVILLIVYCWLPPHLDYDLTQSLPKSVCYWCNKKSFKKSCTQVKPKAERLFFLEFCLSGTRTSSQNLSRTPHDVFLADTSPWMPYDVTRTGKGLRVKAVFFSQIYSGVDHSTQLISNMAKGTVWK